MQNKTPTVHFVAKGMRFHVSGKMISGTSFIHGETLSVKFTLVINFYRWPVLGCLAKYSVTNMWSSQIEQDISSSSQM